MSACLHISLILTVIVSGHLRRTVTRPTQREILNLGTDSWNAGRKEPVFYLHTMYCFLIFELIAYFYLDDHEVDENSELDKINYIPIENQGIPANGEY